MLLSIIILNYKTINLVKHCIKNIENLGLGFDYEIVVVDNERNPKLNEVLKEKFAEKIENGKIKIIKAEKNRGMGAGNNLGVYHAAGEFVLILNPDIVVLENSIEKLLEFIKNRPEVALVAPQLKYPNRNYQPSRYRFPKIYIPAIVRTNLGSSKFGLEKIKKYFMEDVQIAGPHQIDWVRGAAMMIRKKYFQEIGGFDERFFMYLEDTDLCRRLWQKNWQVWYLPEAEMIHYYARVSQGAHWLKDLFSKNTWMHIISWMKYFWKWRKSKN